MLLFFLAHVEGFVPQRGPGVRAHASQNGRGPEQIWGGSGDDDDGNGCGSGDSKRVRKLKKEMKRIGELRTKNYLTLKTAQRVRLFARIVGNY